jgi:FtsH-binding integral membrane protein
VDKFKAIFMYILALVVLLAPAILLGWIGWSLLDWWGGILGAILGLVIFAFSINKIIAQDLTEDEEESNSETSNTNSLVK